MVSHFTEAATVSRLQDSLEETLRALARLHASTDRLRPASQTRSPKFDTFSLAELDRLCGVIREGAAAVTRRLKEISGADATTGARWAELWRRSAMVVAGDRMAAPSDDSYPHPRSLLATYRAACRALCTALQEARHVSDSGTAALLSGLLQRLEKQLWLLDSSRERARVGLPTINLFLSC